MKKLLLLLGFIFILYYVAEAEDIQRGYTWSSSNKTVTADKLHQLVEEADITNINQSDIASNYGLSERSTTQPSDTDSLWYDTTNSLLKVYDGSSYVEVVKSATDLSITNNLEVDDNVKIDGNLSITTADFDFTNCLTVSGISDYTFTNTSYSSAIGNLSLSGNVSGSNPVFVIANLQVQNSDNSALSSFVIGVDSTNMMVSEQSIRVDATATSYGICLYYLFPTLSDAAHTFYVKGKVSAGTGTFKSGQLTAIYFKEKHL